MPPWNRWSQRIATTRTARVVCLANFGLKDVNITGLTAFLIKSTYHGQQTRHLDSCMHLSMSKGAKFRER